MLFNVYLIKNRIQCRSYEQRKQCGERKSENDCCSHTAEHYIEQKRNASEYSGQSSHKYGTYSGNGSFYDCCLWVKPVASLNVYLIKQYDDILDNHTQQSEPSCNTEETELESGE